MNFETPETKFYTDLFDIERCCIMYFGYAATIKAST
jgi:hypothetical protein